MLAVAAEQELHAYGASGRRLWSDTLPERETTKTSIPIDLPTREHRLSRLGLAHIPSREEVRTGYLRLKLDTLLNLDG
jgi:hypothetical protein